MFEMPNKEEFAYFQSTCLRHYTNGQFKQVVKHEMHKFNPFDGCFIPDPPLYKFITDILEQYIYWDEFDLSPSVSRNALGDDSTILATSKFIVEFCSEALKELKTNEKSTRVYALLVDNPSISNLAERTGLITGLGKNGVQELDDRIKAYRARYVEMENDCCRSGQIDKLSLFTNFFSNTLRNGFRYLKWLAGVSRAYKMYLYGESVFEATNKVRILRELKQKLDEATKIASDGRLEMYSSHRQLEIITEEVTSEIESHNTFGLGLRKIKNDRFLPERLLIRDLYINNLMVRVEMTKADLLTIASMVAKSSIDQVTVQRVLGRIDKDRKGGRKEVFDRLFFI